MKDAIIISDLHLGSHICQAKPLWEFLEGIGNRTNKLIINGDVFDSIDFRRLKKHHWHVLSVLRKISDQIDVVWIRGNHDGDADIISHLLGIRVVDEYKFTSGHRKYLVLHGDIFDKFITNHPIITWIADRIYRFIQRLDKDHRLAKFVKRQSKQYLRCTQVVMDKAIKYAEEKGCSVVCCGHTHQPMIHIGPVNYYNSGSWTENPCSFISIHDGVTELIQYDIN